MSGVLVNIKGVDILVDEKSMDIISSYTWNVLKKGYAHCRINGKIKYLHRIIMNAPDDMVVDHINRNTKDNRIENLRICTRLNNVCNSVGQSTSTSKYKGVSWKTDKRKWRASIKLNGKTFHLGYFNDELSAAKVYNERAKKEFGEYAYLNNLS